nr:putative reverse transcriptase domain-containing protein [Tanacetum cinerariifolium]
MANVVTNALSRKERGKPRWARAMAMTIHSGIRGMIIATQGEAFKQENILAKRLHGLDQQMERRENGSLYFLDHIWVPSKNGHDTIWVIVDRLTKSAYFLAIKEDYSTERLARIYIDEIVTRHGVPVSIISDRDGRLTSRCWKTVQKALGTRLNMSTTYHPQTDGQNEHTIQTLEDMLRAYVIDFDGSWDVHLPFAESPVLWAEIRESSLIGPKLIQETTDKGKLAPRYVGPLEILEKIGPVAYRLRFPEELSGVYDTFHVSNLKKCLADSSLHVPLDEIKIDKTLCFVEEPVQIMDHEVKRLKHSRISLVKFVGILSVVLSSLGSARIL